MADDNTMRSYRSNDPYRRAAEPSRASDQTSASDPLAELARLIGQSDPFAEFGRSPRQAQQDTYVQQGYAPAQQGYAPQQGYPAPARDDWQHDAAREQRYAVDNSPSREDYAASEDYAHSLAQQPRAEARHPDDHRYDEAEADQQGQQYADDRTHDQHGGRQADHYYQDDVPLAPDEDEMYDDAPRKRRHGGLATALALIGCAMLGTAGAYAYRSYYGNPSSTQPPPVITADSTTPTKIVPASAGDPQSGKAVQDRVATAGREQIVTKQEEPVALKDLGTQAAPRVVLPAPVAPVQGGSSSGGAAAGASGSAAAASGEAKRVRTVTIRPDGTDVSGRPVGAPPPAGRALDASARATTTPPAPKATAPATAPSRGGNAPLSLEPQSGEPAAAPPARARTAAVPAPETTSTTSSTGGFVVQLSSQKSESEAQSSFRSLQAKFPNELGDRKPIIRRADLGNKGVFYRTNVGPFASAQEASKFCASYKAAGGQCVVPNN